MYGCGCCSNQCERKTTCALYGDNIPGRAIFCIKDFYDSGIGSLTMGAVWFCGPHGDWGMYWPLDENVNFDI